MTILQPIYIRLFNIIFSLTKKIEESLRNKIMLVFSTLLASVFIFKSSGIIIPNFLYVILIIGMICLSINRTIVKIRTNRFFEFVYYLGFLFLFIASLIHSVANEILINSILYLFVFPGLYLIWNNRKDYEVLFNIIAKGFVISGGVYYLICMIFAPISNLTCLDGSNVYFATITNPNGLGILALSVMLCAIYLFISEIGKQRIFYLVIIGISFALIGLSQARTSLVGGILAMAFWCIYYLRRGKYLEGSFIKTLCVLVVIVIVMSISTPITKTAFSVTAPAEAKAFSVSELLEKIGMEGVSGKFQKGTDKNGFLSGRVVLWQYYSENPKVFGYDYKEFRDIAKKEQVALGPHNTIIDILHNGGFISAIGFALLEANVLMFVFLAMLYKRQKGFEHSTSTQHKYMKKEYYTFIILITMAFIGTSMVETFTRSTRWGIANLFFFAITPLLSDDEWKREVED